MATKRGKGRPERSKAKAGARRKAKAPVPAQECEANATAQNDGQVPFQGSASVPTEEEVHASVGDEVPVTVQDEVRVIVEDESSVTLEDEVLVPSEDEAPFPVEREARATTQDKVRFIVGDDTPVGAGDEIQVIAEDEAPGIARDEVSDPISEVAKEEQTLGRRKHARFVVKGGAKGRVAVIWDAVLLDISLGGALIEHANVVRPGTPSSLELDLGGKRIRLRCRVARSVADRIEVQSDGERELIYHTGLQFVEPSDETLQVIGEYIHPIT